MVGVGVAEGGQPPPPDPYYGEYYAPEQYYVPPEMCPHPQQHPQHAHMCTMHEYGGMPVVTSTAMMPPMMPPVMDEGMRHYLVAHPPPHPHHQPHHQPPHHQPQHHQPPPPHHQPQHHYGPANGAGGPQHFYNAGYPPHFHHVPPHHMQHSPPPPVYQKDERTQRQYSKLKQKLERKHINRNNNGIELNSGASTPSLSPRKELNGGGGSGSGSGGASSGAWSEGEGSSAGASLHGDDDDTQAVLDLLTATRTPQVSDMTPTSALVQWNSPLPEGVNLPNDLTYDLLLGDRGGRYKAIYSGPSLSCRVRDLKPGCEYSVCLQIRAGSLTGAASEAATFRAPAAPPERLAAPRVTQRARTTLLLRWATAQDNGARLQHYLLEMDDGEGYRELARPRTRQHTVAGLRAQTRYRFRVAAVNECGRGEWSEDAVVWTAGAPPPAPAPPALLAATPDALTLGWERRADEEFTLQMDDAARGHGFLPVYSGPEREYLCAGLRRATDYRFRLRCETNDGQGPWSTEVTYRTAPERPGAPGRPTPRGKIHSRAFRLRWEPPTDDGGAAVDLYMLELDGGEGYRCAYEGPEREAHCDRLQPGTPYRARVRCRNVAGESEWSVAETVTTEATWPATCPPPEPAAPPRSSLLSVRWRPPDCTGGAPLTEYRVEVVDEEGTVRTAYVGPETECIVRDLAPGHPYKLWVIACNRVGASPPSPVLEFTTAPAPPDAPEAPRATVDSPYEARLEWVAPRNNGAPILDYRLEMSGSNVESAFTEVYRGLATVCTVDKLTPFSPYFFRVCATNSAGIGPFSGVRDAMTPRAPPAAPPTPTHEAAADSLRLHWTAPADHGAHLLKYRVEIDGVTFETEDATPEYTVAGLTPDTEYRVRVAAVSELGEGAWSAPTLLSTRPPPPRPPALRAAAAHHNHLRLEWPAVSEGAHYCVEMRAPDSREFRPVYRGSARSCKVKKLREATTYEFRIRASDERGGRGPWSEPVRAATTAAPPPAPRPPEVTSPAPRVARVTWDPVEVEDATYILQCARAKDNIFKQVYEGSMTECLVEDLECGVEYVWRVCVCRGGAGAGAGSGWSVPRRAALPQPAPPPPRHHRRARAARALTHTQTAILMAGGFLVLAVVVAMLVQRLVERP